MIIEYIFKRKVRTLASRIINNEQEVDDAVDDFLASINWGQLIGMIVRKVIGLLK